MSESVKLPWGAGDPDPNQVYVLPLSLVQVPEPRVTSVFTPEQWHEFVETLKVEGQKDPVKLIWVEGHLWLEDGLNRIMGLKELKISVVKSLVRKGSIGDVQIGNIITARHRGRENPAQTAEVIKDLLDNEHMDKEVCRARLGLSQAWFSKLYKIAKLPPEVKDHIKYGRLSASGAYHLCVLENAVDQISIANDAVQWQYNEEQLKQRVIQVMNPDVSTEDLSFTYGPEGRPQPVYPHCVGCDKELKDGAKYVWSCEACTDLIKAFFASYQVPARQGDNPSSP